jgi:hypothetical protein
MSAAEPTEPAFEPPIAAPAETWAIMAAGGKGESSDRRSLGRPMRHERGP